MKNKKKNRGVKRTLATLTAGLTLFASVPPGGSGVIHPLSSVAAEASTISTQQAFFNKHGHHASEIAANNNLYASVMLAQMALESNYGRSTLSLAPDYNLFGIKGEYNGRYVVKSTWEDDGKGNSYIINAKFRSYPSAEHSMQDYARFVSTTRYNNVKVPNTKSYEDATFALQGNYATDTRYASKLNTIISTYNLTQYDKLSPADFDVTENVTTYKVVSGDNLTKIAAMFKISISELRSFNNLKSDVIHVGQILKVRTTSYVEKPTVTAPPVEEPTVTAPPVEESVENVTTYKVVSGDSLSKIANKYKTTVANLKSLNNLKSDVIYVGQTLKIKSTTVVEKPTVTTPPVEVKPVEKPTVTTPKPVETVTTYKIVSGDTLSKIAVKYKTTVANLKSLNNLKSDVIYVGQTLKVKSTTVAEKPTVTTPPVEVKPVEKPTVTTPVKVTTYKVVSGDTLSKIAVKYKTTVANLKSLNNLKSDVIYVGQTLKLQSSGTTTSKPNEVKPSVTTPVNVTTYKIVSGDSLSKIAVKYKTTVANLKSLNNLKSDVIYIGQTLKVKK